jgi:hypothetical protein
MSYSWSNDPTKSAIHATASRQASDRGKQPINVFRCSVHARLNTQIALLKAFFQTARAAKGRHSAANVVDAPRQHFFCAVAKLLDAGVV